MPTSYSGDAHEVLARLQAAAEGDTVPLARQVIHRLGAPFGARWNAYPAPDKPLMLALGTVARLTGIFFAANAGLLIAQVTSALAFFLVARWMRVRWEWAMAGGLLFAYTFSTFGRGLEHFSLVFSWTVPLGLLAVWWVAGSRRLEWRRPGAWICVAAGVALGAHNPYNLYFWLQLMGWAVLMQWFGPRRRPNLQVGLAAIVAGIVLFLAMNSEGWVHVDEPQAQPLLARNYGGTERFALKPVELLIPPKAHRWESFAFLGNRYARWSDWRGEEISPYLGLVGMAGLAWLTAAALHRLLARRFPPGASLALGWLMAFATVGGGTNLVSFFTGWHVFRATNRVGIFISAIVLFFLVTRLSRLTARWSPALRVTLAAGVAALGILDQVPREATARERQEITAAVESDRQFGREVEAALPSGSMIFQLPVMGFPEVVPPWRLADYEHFRLYLHTHDVRFSYGAAKNRSRSRWQRDLEVVAPRVMARQLEQYGFAALYLNRKGFEDRGEALLGELRRLGYDDIIQSSRGQQVVVRLRPAAAPRLPLARAFTFGQGWHPRTPDTEMRWAFAPATLSYYNPYDTPITLEVRFTFESIAPGEFLFAQEGVTVGRVRADGRQATLHLPELILAPGVNRFRLESDQPAERRGSGRYQLRSFGLSGVSLRVRHAPDAPDLTGD